MALRLADQLEDPEDLFRARLNLFTTAVDLRRTATAERLWAELDPMGPDWPRSARRSGTAERWHTEFQYRRGRPAAGELDRGPRLAREGRNRIGVVA